MSTDESSRPPRHGLFTLQVILGSLAVLLTIATVIAAIGWFQYADRVYYEYRDEYQTQGFVTLFAGLGAVLGLFVTSAVIGVLARMEESMYYMLESLEITRDNTYRTVKLLDGLMHQRQQSAPPKPIAEGLVSKHRSQQERPPQ